MTIHRIGWCALLMALALAAGPAVAPASTRCTSSRSCGSAGACSSPGRATNGLPTTGYCGQVIKLFQDAGTRKTLKYP